MSYIEKNLLAGESVVYKTRLHWIVLTGHIVLAAVFGIPGLYLFAIAGAKAQLPDLTPEQKAIAGIVLLVIAAVLIVMGNVRRNATVMVVTNKRVLIKVGLMSRRTWEMTFSKIESIGVEEPMLGRVFGYGTVIIRGVGGTPETFARIAQPIEFRKQVERQIEGTATVEK